MYLNDLKENIDNEINQLNNIAMNIGVNTAVIKDWNKKAGGAVASPVFLDGNPFHWECPKVCVNLQTDVR